MSSGVGMKQQYCADNSERADHDEERVKRVQLEEEDDRMQDERQRERQKEVTRKKRKR